MGVYRGVLRASGSEPEAAAQPQLHHRPVQLCELGFPRDTDVQVKQLKELLARVEEDGCEEAKSEVLSEGLGGACGLE